MCTCLKRFFLLCAVDAFPGALEGRLAALVFHGGPTKYLRIVDRFSRKSWGATGIDGDARAVGF